MKTKAAIATKAGQKLTLRQREGYDHLKFHAQYLKR